MKSFLIVCVFLVCSQFVGAQNERPLTFGDVKQWQFQVANRKIRVTLDVRPVSVKNNRTVSVLVFEPEGDFRPTVSEEVDFLKQVLREMPSLQRDPSNLVMINTWLQNSEFLKGVEGAVFKSGIWKSCTGRMYCYPAQGVADQFLSSVNAFKEIDVLLHEYGLRRKAVHMDDMGVGMKDGKLDCSGLIVVSIEKEK